MCRYAAILSLIVLSTSSSAPLRPVLAEDAAAATSPLLDVVVTRGPTQVRVRLSAAADGTSWHDRFERGRALLADALFVQLDGDRNGELSFEEAKRIPNPQTLTVVQQTSDVYVAFNFRVLDENGDGRATPDELSQYLAYFAGSTVATQHEKEPLGRLAGHLFARLDADGDGRLTPDECRNQAALWTLDLDRNGVLTGNELSPPEQEEQREFLAKPLGARRIPVTLSFEPPGDMMPDFIAIAMFEDDEAADSMSDISLISAAASIPEGVQIVPRASRTQALSIDGQIIEFRLAPSSFRYSEQLQQAVRRQFDASVDGETGAVSRRAADLPSPLRDLFPVADGDHDGTLTASELTTCLGSFLAAHLAAESARLRVTAIPEGHDVAALADANFDGKISRREAAGLADRVFGSDNTRASIGPDEIAGVTRIVVQRGPFLNVDVADMLSELGPAWFFRADRNRDGDLDRDEFLGAADQFARFDGDGDGWIDLDEAIRADRQLEHDNTRPVEAKKPEGLP